MDSLPLVDPALPGLQDARPAGVFPFLVEGESIWVYGTASRPELHVGAGRRRIVTIKADGLGTAANLLLHPGMSRRDFATTGGTVVETALAIPTLPLVVVQWDGQGDGRPPSIEVFIHGAAGDVRSGDTEVSGPGGLEIRLVPTATDVHLDDGEGGTRVTLLPVAEGHVSLVVGLGDADGRRSAPMAAAGHARSHAVRAAAGPGEGLLLHTGIAEVDDAVAWLRTRLAGQARRLAGDTDPAVARSVGLAASAIGDREASAKAVVSTEVGSATRALLAGRHASVFGETREARECAARWTRPGEEPPSPSPLVALAATELADALHMTGDAETVSKLRGLAASTPVLAPTGRSLPMAGRTASTSLTESATLRMLLAGDPASVTADPDTAWAEWRRQLVDDSGRTVTLWDQEPPWTVRTGSVAADLMLALASGILGVRADAPAGRIRIAPRLPRHLTRFEATGIRVGRSVVTLRYTSTPEVSRFEIEPVEASVPPLLVFEPAVSGRPVGVRVDGEVADLRSHESGTRTVIPVQLPLDATRIVEIIRAMD